MKLRSKKLIIFMITLSMILSTGVGVFGEQEKTGNPWNPGPVGSLNSEGDVKIEKSAVKVEGEENRFKVTLTIQGKGKEEPDTTDTVLVLDESGSMKGNKNKNVREAAKNLVEEVLKANASNQIGIVRFEKKAVIEQFLTNNSTNLNDAIDNLGANGATNIQDALRKAKTVISNSNADNKYIVLLSDGEPTLSFKGTRATTSSGISVLGKSFILDHFDYDSVKGTGGDYKLLDSHSTDSYKKYLVDGFEIDNNGIATVSESLNINVPIYTIGFGQISPDAKKVLSEVGDSGAYYTADNTNDLIAIFTKITMTAYSPIVDGKVIDPIGPMFTYIANSADTEDGTVSYKSNSNKIVWDVGNVLEGKTATMTYEVILNVESDDPEFEEDTYYPMNGETTLEYTDINGRDAEENFLIPEAKGKKPVIQPEPPVIDPEPTTPPAIEVPDKPDKPKRPKPKPELPPIVEPEPELPPVIIEPEPELPPVIETPIIPPVVEVPKPVKPLTTLPKTGSGIDTSLLGAGLLAIGTLLRKFIK